MSLRWGYKANGESCLFEIPDGQPLPAGWSDNHLVIELAEMRTAESITRHAGTSAQHPVKVEEAAELDMRTTQAHGASFPGPFHRDPAPTEPPRRGPGRPPLSKDDK